MREENRLLKCSKLLGVMSLGLAVIAIVSSCTVPASNDVKKADIPALLAKTTPFQAEMLKDGVVDRSEYEKAILAQRQCAIEAGGVPGEVKDIGNNQLGYEVEFQSPKQEDIKVFQEAHQACRAKFSREVIEAWTYQQLLSPREKENQRPKVIDCLNSKGVEIPADATADKIFQLSSNEKNQNAYLECARQFPGFFDTTDKK